MNFVTASKRWVFLLFLKVFPGDLLPSTYTDPRKKKVKARTELERRERYMSPLEATMGKTHGLVSLVKGCLENDPRRRPTASQALDMMRNMMARLRPPFLHVNRWGVTFFALHVCYTTS